MAGVAARKLRILWPPLLCLLIVACSSASNPPGSQPSPTSLSPAERGAALYQQNCAPCHRENGQGVPNVYPSIAGSTAVRGDPIELAQWVLSQKRPASIPAGRYPTQMLLFGWMKDEDAAALLTYIRSSIGNSAPPIDAAMIARAREKHGNDRH